MYGKPRILVAEDDADLLNAVTAAIQAQGAEVVSAASGAELIRAQTGRGRFDLLITDVAMPWMTGLQAMHAARAAGLHVPVIVMTALRDESIPARVRALGDEAVLLRKPFELAELQAAVAAFLAPAPR